MIIKKSGKFLQKMLLNQILEISHLKEFTFPEGRTRKSTMREKN